MAHFFFEIVVIHGLFAQNVQKKTFATNHEDDE
jgi:hypothetical protein